MSGHILNSEAVENNNKHYVQDVEFLGSIYVINLFPLQIFIYFSRQEKAHHLFRM